MTAHTAPGPNCSPQELDEAAVWMARLHAPDRTASAEQGFRRWLDEKPTRAVAFETVTTAWELTGALQRRPFPKLSRWQRAGYRSGFLGAAAIVLSGIAVLAVIAVVSYTWGTGYTTDVGEQRVLTLDDGTRVTLNTSSQIAVHFNALHRRVELKEGEALFEVARNPAWPFTVVAGDRQVLALGTAFLVRRDEQQLTVTLVEGKVAISLVATPGSQEKQSAPALTAPAYQDSIVTLAPGQRFTLASGTTAKVDTPSIEKISAWRSGHVELDDAVLVDAAAEMNRYSATKVLVESPRTAALRINGVFRVGDTGGFAAAVAKSYGLRLEQRGHDWVLSGTPSGKVLTEAAQK